MEPSLNWAGAGRSSNRPSSRRTTSLTLISLEALTTYTKIDRAMPRNTAHCTGRIRVAISVKSMIRRGPTPTSHTSAMRARLMVSRPATMSRAAMAGSATNSTRLPKSRTSTIKISPENTLAQRDRAPELLLNAVPASEPPTGRPWKKPATVLPMPCPKKSREVSGYSPSGLGIFWLTPAPWIRPMRAIPMAGSRSLGTRDRVGRAKRGSAPLIS